MSKTFFLPNEKLHLHSENQSSISQDRPVTAILVFDDFDDFGDSDDSDNSDNSDDFDDSNDSDNSDLKTWRASEESIFCWS